MCCCTVAFYMPYSSWQIKGAHKHTFGFILYAKEYYNDNNNENHERMLGKVDKQLNENKMEYERNAKVTHFKYSFSPFFAQCRVEKKAIQCFNVNTSHLDANLCRKFVF